MPMPISSILYETKLSALSNIRLEVVRKVNETKVYCIGRDRNGRIMHNFSGYYFKSELTRIINP